jgi:hypothetical protein
VQEWRQREICGRAVKDTLFPETDEVVRKLPASSFGKDKMEVKTLR